MTDLGPILPPERTELQPVEVVDAERASPRWGVFTKFLFSLIFVVLLGALLVRFQEMIAPLVMAVILAYLLRPAVAALSNSTRLSWGASVAVVYLTLVVLVGAVVTVAGIAIVQQIQGLYRSIEQITTNLPDQLELIFSQPVHLGPLGTIDLLEPFSIGPFGPFRIPIDSADWVPLYQQVVNAIQPLLSRTGDVVSSLATSTAGTLGWTLFILVISYYLVNDLRTPSVSMDGIVPEGYEYDVRRLTGELGPIWNAFLRGQITLGIVMGVVVGVTMAVLGVRYALVLGLIAGLLEFIPIVGPVIAGTVAVLVALFQPDNWLGLNPLAYAGVVLLASIVLQQIENNFLVPRILGASLKLHPIIILVGAVIAANLAGIVGLLLSAPILATLRLVGRYIARKMTDQDPWPEPVTRPRAPAERTWARLLRRRASEVWARLRRPPAGP